MLVENRPSILFLSEEKRLLQHLLDLVSEHSSPVYLVGGYLRDRLLGRESRDIDLAVSGNTRALGLALAASLKGSYTMVDPRRDISRVVVPGENTHKWSLDLVGFEGSLYKELVRRDFTMNALAMPLDKIFSADPTNCVIDHWAGIEDIRQRRVRLIQDQAFRDDPVRLLRAARLGHHLGFSLDSHTGDLARRDSALLSQVSGERLRDELLRLLDPPGVLEALEMLDALGLLTSLFPELEEGRGVSQPSEHYWTVLEHNLQCSAAVEIVIRDRRPEAWREEAIRFIPWDSDLRCYFSEELSDGHSRATLLKLAGLLHDIAKPRTRQVDAGGRIRFLGHHRSGAQIVKDIAERLRFSGQGVRFLSSLVDHHLRPTQLNLPGELPTARAVFRFFRDCGEEALGVIYLNLADYLAARGPDLDISVWRRHIGVVSHLIKEGRREEQRKMDRLVTGHDLMRELSLDPGWKLGRLLAVLEEAQATGAVSSRAEALLLARVSLATGEERKGDIVEAEENQC